MNREMSKFGAQILLTPYMTLVGPSVRDQFRKAVLSVDSIDQLPPDIQQLIKTAQQTQNDSIEQILELIDK